MTREKILQYSSSLEADDITAVLGYAAQQAVHPVFKTA
jgi:hypothetical protein